MIPRARKRRRSKIRKPRFLSLRQMTTDNSNRDDSSEKKTKFEQLDLFPLHPELMLEEEEEEEEKVEEDAGDDTPSSSFFYPDLGAAVTLTSLFGESDVNATSVVKEEEEEGERLDSGGDRRGGRGMLCLKLDYEKILNAWSEKGSLYIRDDDYESQIVPQLHPFSSEEHTYWTAPENGGGDRVEMIDRKERVMRYKEKRRLRLFSKRIRYQVRKLNAEKRPRIKGRFVKRVD